MWGFDGEKFGEATKPYSFRKGERVRVTLINDTMMAQTGDYARAPGEDVEATSFVVGVRAWF